MATRSIKALPLNIQGIKTELVSFIMHNVKCDGQGRWVEPFLGSGVVALNVNPERALLADTHEHIIHFYGAVQTGEMNPYDLKLPFRTRRECAERKRPGPLL